MQIMRIVSGKFGGRKLIVPEGRDIRPTSDKIRGSVFNILRSRGAVEGANALDICCGTGALGLEALSQGAQFCAFIDNNRESVELCKANIAALGIKEEAFTMIKDATKLTAWPAALAQSNLVFIDPPYRKDLIKPILDTLFAQDWLEEGALCVLEAEKQWQTTLPPQYKLQDERDYGDTKIVLATYQP